MAGLDRLVKAITGYPRLVIEKRRGVGAGRRDMEARRNPYHLAMPVDFRSVNAQRLNEVRARIAAQPNWVVRAAALTFALIILLPILVLVAVAFAAAFIVLLVLGLVNRVAGLFAGRTNGLLPRRDGQGRRNVKVLPREG